METYTPAPHLLSPDQEHELQRRIDVGVLARAALDRLVEVPSDATPRELELLVEDGERAHRRLVEANLGLVWFVVNPVSARTGQASEELYQEGVVGLLEAIHTFDPDIGRFATWALQRIRLYVRDAAVTNHGSLGLPARRARKWRRAASADLALSHALGRRPTVAEIAAEIGETETVTAGLLEFVPAVPLAFDDPTWLASQPSAAPMEADPGHADEVERLLTRLDAQQRQLIVTLYGLGGPVLTTAQVAEAAGRSVSTIRRWERQALAQLRADRTGTRPEMGTMVA